MKRGRYILHPRKDAIVVPAVAAQQLRETYWHYAIHAAALRSVGVQPIMIKGSAIGRIYRETGLRPSAGIDLCVSPEQYATARVLNQKG